MLARPNWRVLADKMPDKSPTQANVSSQGTMLGAGPGVIGFSQGSVVKKTASAVIRVRNEGSLID